MKKSLGIYVHVPFCIKKCRYCDFCSVAGKDSEYISVYTAELCRRIEEFAPKAREYKVDTVYLGGGTPSLLPIKCVDKIFNTLDKFNISDSAEITMECNPATAKPQYFYDIRSLGINRLSIGLQSAKDNELKLLGRAHGVRDFVQCFEDARKAGLDNISADLMYGIPDQTMDSFRYSLGFLSDLAPEHISAYGLSIEEGTYFHKHLAQLNMADDDMQADMYSMMCEYLEIRGYHRYEISNFSKVGKESRHNTRYWTGLDYIGFGVAAHSCFGGVRFGNSRDIDAFLRSEDITEERYVLDDEELKKEYIMLGMRMERGIDLSEYEQRFGKAFATHSECVKRYLQGGFLKLDGGRMSFTEKGFLVSNVILSELTQL